MNNKYKGTPVTHWKIPHKTPSAKDYEKECYTHKTDASDSEESVGSNGSSEAANFNIRSELSIVAQFDDLLRLYKQRPNLAVEQIFYSFVEQTKGIIDRWRIATEESRRLQTELDKKNHDLGDLENKLTVARKLLDQQKRNTRKAEEERDVFEEQLTKVQDVLTKEFRNKITDETREKLPFLNNQRCSHYDQNVNGRASPPLSAIPEINSTGSLLSDFSYSISEDDLDTTSVKHAKGWKKHRSSMGNADEPAVKKRRSSGNKVVEIGTKETVRATTTLTLSKHGPITATSIIESLPKDEKENINSNTPNNVLKPTIPSADIIYDLWQASPQYTDVTNNNLRQHSLHTKTVVMPDICGPCEKRIRFGKTALKCRNCRAMCHLECKNNLPLPCVPSVNTPTQRNATGVIGDFTPITPPMVPALVVHCLKEIEAKGLTEIGIYRIPGPEKDEKFLRGKGVPNLNHVDVHVICGTVKDFLRSLSEPLVTYALWPEFVKAVQAKDEQDIQPAFYQIISELPQPNRDTLAYMILHLKKVALAKDCKMPASNLSKVFGPTIVGYSSSDPNEGNLLEETRQQVSVMERLINLPIDYWMSFVNGQQKLSKLQQTPSTDSLLRPTVTRGFFTPNSARYYVRPNFIKQVYNATDFKLTSSSGNTTVL
ncbi:rac gtpase-activating protein 1 [Holotrichia oblita]|uniref:Rac gtpase-activating protein 1 n=1 Tax=Holotrichia oblita TaxID=644536 RepID=A0ACB9TTB8_HOLOL|nr:rac gtpase-activating protein 1 [Holotrichia oblita]